MNPTEPSVPLTLQHINEISSGLRALAASTDAFNRSTLINTRWRKVNASFLIIVFITLIGFGLILINGQSQIKQGNLYVKECTTPGTRIPTSDDPSTGHRCYDDGNKRAAQYFQELVDSQNKQLTDLRNAMIDSNNKLVDALNRLSVQVPVTPTSQPGATKSSFTPRVVPSTTTTTVQNPVSAPKPPAPTTSTSVVSAKPLGCPKGAIMITVLGYPVCLP